MLTPLAVSGWLLIAGHPAQAQVVVDSTGLTAADDTAIGPVGESVTFVNSAGATPTLTITGTFSSDRAFILQDTGNIAVDAAQTFTISGVVSGAGALEVGGAGTLVLSNAANTYTGGTNITGGGTLSVAVGGSLGDAAGIVTFSAAGGTLLASATTEIGQDVVLTTGGTISAAGGTTLTISGDISGAGALTLAGAGTKILSGTNTHTGGTVLGGSVQISSAASLGDVAGGITFAAGGGSLIVTQSTIIAHDVVLQGAGGMATTGGATATYSGVISGAGALTISGGGTAVLSGINTYTGATSISGTGTLSISDGQNLGASSALNFSGAGAGQSGTLRVTGDTTITQDINLATGGTLSTSDGKTATFSGSIAGVANLTIAGGGTTVLTGVNTYSGATTITGSSTLSIGASANLGATSGLVFSGAGSGELQLTVSDTITQGITLTGDGTLNAGVGVAATYSGVISGAGDLTISGAGTTTLSGANTYTGSTTIDAASALSLSVAAASTTTYAGAFLGSGSLNITGGGTVEITGASNFSGALSIDAGNSLNLATAGSTATYSGVISGDGALTISGLGETVLSGINTYSSTTIIRNDGTLSVGGVTNLGTSGALEFGVGGGTLIVTSTTDFTNTILLTGNGGIGAGDGQIVTYSGVISGAGGLSIAGSGTTVITGVNTYTGATTITGSGTLSIVDSTSLGASSGLAFNGAGVGGTLSVTGADATVTHAIALTGSGTLSIAAGNTGTFSGIISGVGGLTVSGGGTTLLSGANTYTGSTTVSAGSALTMDVGVGNTTTYAGGLLGGGSLSVTGGGTAAVGGASNFSGAIAIGNATSLSLSPGVGTTATFSGVISGLGDLTIAGGGTTVLSGVNTFGGAITVDGASTLSISSATNLGAATDIVFSGSGAGQVGMLALSSASTITQDLTLTTAAAISAAGAGSSTLSGTITGAAALSILGGGTVILSGDNSATFTGGVIIDASSTLSIASTNAIGGNGAAITLDNGGELLSTNSATLSGAITVNQDGGALTIGAGKTMVLSGSVADGEAIAGDLTLGGGGAYTISANGSGFDGDLLLTGGSDATVTSAGASAFAGGATVGNGSILNGTGSVLGAIAVSAGGTLAGTGTFGATTIAAGGLLAPGNSAGTITLDSLSVAAAGDLEFEIENNGVAIVADRIVVTGTATVTAGADLSVIQTNFIPNGTIEPFIDAGGVTTIGAVDMTTLLVGTDGIRRSVIPITTYALEADGDIAVTRTATAFQDAAAAAGATGYQMVSAAAIDQAAAAADTDPFGSGAAFVYSIESLSITNEALLALIGGMSPAADAASTQMPMASTRLFGRSHLEYSDDRRRAFGASQWFAASNAGRLSSADDGMVTEALSAQAKAQNNPDSGGQRTNVYGRFVGGTSNYNGSASQPGFDQNTYQALAGVDYVVERGFMVGFVGGFSRDTASIVDGSSLDADSLVFAPYVILGGDEGWYLDAMLNGGFGWWSSSRVVNVGTTATADFNEWSVGGIARTGYDWYLNDDWRLSPELSFIYLHVNNGSYTETGAGNSSLAVESRTQDNALIDIGPELGWDIELERGRFASFTVQGGWEYMFGSQTSISASFVSGGGNFLTPISNPDASRAFIGTSLAWPVSDSTTLTIEYEGLFSGDTSANGGMATLGFTF